MGDPIIAQKGPYVVEVEPGTYAWCACGKSTNQPYCDGSHRGSEFRPIIQKIDAKQQVAWCGCKHSAKKPFCDGTHRTL
ncbi:MAG: CDGSH iron-sulfur domain-containing protein [Candidatus Omnitrophota bacterium]|nr:CDGSH iron-sulfur domain-containing protein [Candidatus Omnitrophota bacterium]MDZ4241775.1 CDGSH iron-sulfur domain-containing protein [Candidatus Omnitrophota bacterium]